MGELQLRHVYQVHCKKRPALTARKQRYVNRISCFCLAKLLIRFWATTSYTLALAHYAGKFVYIGKAYALTIRISIVYCSSIGPKLEI